MTHSPFKHVALIMDGNRRWAKGKGMPVLEGHRRGVETAEAIMRHADKLGLQYLTLYTFSTENWKRPLLEVTGLMSILTHYLKHKIADLHKENVRFLVLGDTSKFSKSVQKLLTNAIDLTAQNTGLSVVLALNYGGRQELIDAAQKAILTHPQDQPLTEALFQSYLYRPDMPDPDVMIRTGGDTRISNYLLWQMAYTELHFTDTLWPDFSAAQFEEILAACINRERRYGR